ncbi:hypothetical protein [Nocardia sienata]|uniref:hypothetical protein n=1 Tax=Nocardia sienata TaxID=248552 RepID=UPI0012EE5108|nr:hypothetical protein [Nocardia sienata]
MSTQWRPAYIRSEVAGVHVDAIEVAAHARTLTVGVPDRPAGAASGCVERAAGSR